MPQTSLTLLPLSVLVLSAACSPPIDTKKAEGFIKSEMLTHGVTMANVTCPTGLNLKPGMTFQCTGADDQGTHAIFDMTVTDNHGTVSWQLEGKYMDMKVEGDSLEKALSIKAGKPVDVVCPSKNIIIAKGTTFTCSVMVGAESGKITLTFTSNDGSLYDYKITKS